MSNDDLKKQIIKNLNSTDTVDIMYGLEDIKDLYPDESPDDEIIDYLITYLRSEEVILQETSARILGHYPYKKVVKKLTPFLNDPSIEIRNAVNLIFHNLGNKKEVFDELLPHLQNEDEDIIIFILDILIKVADDSCIEVVLESTTHKNENIVLKAFEVIGSIGSRKSEDFFVNKLKEENLDINQKGTIILQISKLKKDYLESFIIDYEKENESLLSIKCKSLGLFGKKKSFLFLTNILNNYPDKQSLLTYSLEAISKLAKSCPDDFKIWVKECNTFNIDTYILSEKEKVQKHAIIILGVLKPPGYIDTIISFLKGNKKSLKENSLDALSNDDSNKAMSLIRLMQFDLDQEVAMKARLIIQTKTLEVE